VRKSQKSLYHTIQRNEVAIILNILFCGGNKHPEPQISIFISCDTETEVMTAENSALAGIQHSK